VACARVAEEGGLGVDRLVRHMSEWRVKYDGVCSRCGIALRTGDVAVYERPTRTIRCVACPVAEQDTASEPEIDVGVAGRSARQEHERRAAKREAKAKERWGERIGGVVLALTDEPQSTRAWAIGARGEEKLAEALAGFNVLHDRRVPGTRGNLDHIVVAPAGVFVVDAKHLEGRIEIRNHGWFLRPDERLHVGRRDCSGLADKMGWQVAAVEAALRGAGLDPVPPIVPVLCFIDGDWPLIAPPNVFRGVRLEGPRSLRKRLVATSVLDEGTIARLIRILGAALPPK
jgi:hypothetical protein